MKTSNISELSIPAELAALLPKMLQEFAARSKVKQETKIIVLTENENDKSQLVNYLHIKGFSHTTGLVAAESNKGLDYINADLVIFHRSSMVKTYDRIGNSFINTYVKAFSEKQALLYFGPYNRELDTKTEQIVFANYRQKLEGNILDLLEDRRDMKKMAEKTR